MIPEIIVIGDIEMAFVGAALALGFPKMARRVLRSKYGPSVGKE